MLNPLTLDDVAAVVRLLGDIAGTDDPIAAKRRQLVGGLATLCGADVWVWAHAKVDADDRVAYFAYLDGGWASDAQRSVAMSPECSPEVRPIEQGMVRAALVAHATRTREQFVEDAAWYGSPLYRRFRAPADLDDFLFSYYPVGDGVISGVGLHRRLGRPRFADRERCLAHLVLGQIDWLHRADTAVPAADRVADLTARQRQVLLLLMGGDGRKQVARKLGLSDHTVADYTKVLYRHFDVNSRAELLAKFMAGDAGGRAT